MIVPTLFVGMPHGTLRVLPFAGDAQRHGMHYHAERGNDQWRAIKAIPVAEREQDPTTDTTSLPPLYPK